MTLREVWASFGYGIGIPLAVLAVAALLWSFLKRKDRHMHSVELGIEGRDEVTGFQGIITGHATYLSGCNQTLLVPRVGPDGSYRPGEWFDDQRIIHVVAGRTVALDNSRTPGPDRQAPKR